MIVWNRGTRTLELGEIGERECPNCETVQPVQLDLDYGFFSLYWIFKRVTKKVYSLSCTECGEWWELDDPSKVEATVGKPPIPFMHRYGLLSLGVFVVLLIAAGLSETIERNTAGVIVGEGDLSVFSVRVGDCYDADFADNPEATDLDAVAGIPCTDPHDNEVYAVFDIDLVSYPDEEEVSAVAFLACLERFQSFVGEEYESSVLDIQYLYPTIESFAQQDREVTCAVYHMEGDKLVGSVMGSAW